MIRHTLRLALAGALALGSLGPGRAAEPVPPPPARVFAVVAPSAGNPFYEAVVAGCRARAEAIGAIDCRLFAPGGAEKRNQGEIIRALVGEKVAGIAVSPALLSEVVPALREAEAAGIPVVAFDADLPADLRFAFIGTDARDFGRALGASLGRWKPEGGRYALLTGSSASRGLTDRVDGVRDALGAKWTEIAGSPLTTSGEARDAADQLDHLLLGHPELDAVVSVGAWPFLAETTWREIASRHKERIDRARVVLVVADALPPERRLVRDGLGHVLVGQRPADMGARIVDVLAAKVAGRPTPEIVYTGFDVLTRRDLLGTDP